MTEHDMQQRLDQLRALLGLDLVLPERDPAGPAPDSEDLAALLDGSLDATRRAQVISYLLVDDDLYEEWLLLSEHADLLPAPAPAPVATGDETTDLDTLTWWQRLTGWRPAVLVGAVAATALVITLNRDATQDPIDQLYAQHTAALHQALGTLPDVVSRSPSQPWNTWQLALASGLDDGLDALNHERNLYDIDRQRLHEAGDRYRGQRSAELDDVADTGRLALLGVLICAQQDDAAAQSVMRELTPRWSAVSAGSPVAAPELDPAEALESACMAGEWALQALR
ncbi:hypothetical protein [Isoalcanivorax indicus]|uniref:hypothetical protein n=1 Tax=Isoalcanivorax indicus TaxID=2202653 RepID=UPI0013C42B38|nr:hypothetical protein [Isoalcanivorax indicus]